MVEQDNNYRSRWVEDTKRDREVAYKILQRKSIEVGKDSRELLKYLDMQVKFDLYSPSNCLLLLAQMPEATYCREAVNWQKEGYKVRLRDKSAVILEPSKPILREDGSSHVYYNPKRVYDISATNAPRKESKPFPKEKDVLRALLRSSPINVQAVDSLDTEDKCALYNENEHVLCVCRNKDTINTIQDVVYEISKYYMDIEAKVDRDINSFKSTCVTYMFCKKYGIEFPEEIFNKLENQLNGNDKVIRDRLSNMNEVSGLICNRVDGAIEKERKSREQVR